MVAWVSSHGLIFEDSPKQSTHIVHTTPNTYSDFEDWIRKYASFGKIHVYAGFDCCRVMPKWASYKELKKDSKGEDDEPSAAGQLCMQFGARKKE